MRGFEGKENEQKAYDAEQGKGKLLIFADGFFVAEELRFIAVSNRCRHKENGDIDPIGGFSDHTVVGVEDGRNQAKSEQRASELDTPKIWSIPKEKALHDSKEKHRPEEKLHMLPGGFVDTRDRGDPHRASRPIV